MLAMSSSRSPSSYMEDPSESVTMRELWSQVAVVENEDGALEHVHQRAYAAAPQLQYLGHAHESMHAAQRMRPNRIESNRIEAMYRVRGTMISSRQLREGEGECEGEGEGEGHGWVHLATVR